MRLNRLSAVWSIVTPDGDLGRGRRAARLNRLSAVWSIVTEAYGTEDA